MNGPVTLYQFGGGGLLPSLSPPCLKVWLALRRIGVPHRVEDVSAWRARRVSPSGRVPALAIDGRTLVDSCAILDALEERFPACDAWPRDEQERIVDRLWDHFVTDTLYWGGVVQRYLVPRNREAAWDLFFGRGPSLRRTIMAPLIVWEIRRRARAQGVGRRPPEDVRAQYESWLGMIDRALEPGPFLQGRSVPGRGDLAVASHVAQIVVSRALPPIGALLERRPRLEPHARAVFDACGASLDAAAS